MPKISCETCPFFGPGVDGRLCCHSPIATGVDDATRSPDWWCSEHPQAPGQRDRIAERIAQGMAYGMAKSWTPSRLAEDAYQIADAMMARRGKP